MKPVFKCEYCNFMGTEEDVSKHELKCIDNYDRKSCLTCKHKKYKSWSSYKCDCGKDIPEGRMFEFCPQYERKEKEQYTSKYSNIFSSMFGGF